MDIFLVVLVILAASATYARVQAELLRKNKRESKGKYPFYLP